MKERKIAELASNTSLVGARNKSSSGCAESGKQSRPTGVINMILKGSGLER